MCRGVTRLDGAWTRNKFEALVFEPEIFRKPMYCFEICACDIFVAFCPPQQ